MREEEKQEGLIQIQPAGRHNLKHDARDAVCHGASHQRLELEEVRAKLEGAKGPQYWRCLEELAGSKAFEEMLHREFPRQASEWVGGDVSRRNFLKLMSASLALAGMAGCTKLPVETIVPYVRQPEEIIPGRPLFFATAMELGGYAQPLLARSNEGRPTKLEGNPEHPVSQGATDVYAQAVLLDLYDPDRSQTSTYGGEVEPWSSFIGAMQGPIAAQKATGGSGFRLLTQSVSSPTLLAQIRSLQKNFPEMKWHQWEAVNRDGARGGAQMAFGQQVETRYLLENADVVVALDADFLSSGFPGFTMHTRDWAKRRNPDHPAGMNRTYAIESTPTTSGFKADHRLPVRASEVAWYARVLAAKVGVGGAATDRVNPENLIPPEVNKWLDAVGKDLQQHRGRAVVIPGEYQPPVVHALAHAMNEALGAAGATVLYTDPIVEGAVSQAESIKELVADMNAGKVQLLLILGGNPVFDAPADLNFEAAMGKVPLRIHHGLYQNETSVYTHWHVNANHFLEEWSDTRALNGMVSVVQPLIAPLYGGRSAHEVLAVFNGQPDTSSYELVRAYWKSQYSGNDFEGFWQQAVHDGFMAGTESTPKPVKVTTFSFQAISAPPTSPNGEFEIAFRHDPCIFDGRYANNGWLQELEKPVSKLTWDNVVNISPADAKKLGVKEGQDATVVKLNYRGREVEAPLWPQPGQPDGLLTVFFGYGRTRGGRTASDKGFNAYKVRFSDASSFGSGAKITKTGATYRLASLQGYQMLEGRNVVRSATVATYKQNPGFAHQNNFAPPRTDTLYPNYQYNEYAWGMEIDLNSCVGCNACIVACQAENNIPVVGKEQTMRGRKMHWLRVDGYFEGDPANPRMYYEPLPCMQCEDAPCEVVCPVGATVHSSEGLNDMVYNRCVGTRYCQNNCPWKVRRFNFLLFNDWNTPQLKMVRNPEVTVRSRGVMEKCTYCVQRITKARIAAEEEDRRVRDQEILTACQQVCPANAIIFGDINDPNSSVRRFKEHPRNFGVLEELNTRPRTTYMAAVLNPNPEIPEAIRREQPEQHF
ncbi:MAG TPA: TAT-variant-translocated molybdopterin oxidoreductase [Terriglobales bacterium]|nr:TAT-variant-translocated molybdopterin oxidoreductase [Terriglobales bacterium]